MMTSLHQQSMLSALGGKAGYAAFRCRQRKARYQDYTQQMLAWRQIFQLGEVVVLAGAAAALILLDFLTLSPIYRQVSEIIAGDADLLFLPIGIGVNMAAIVCSERLSKCSSAGPFQAWARARLAPGHRNDAMGHLLVSRRQRRQDFLLSLVLYLAILLLFIWMRFTLLQGSELAMERVELPITLAGLLLSVLTVMIGIYLLPLGEYLGWSAGKSLLYAGMKADIRHTAELDGDIYQLWSPGGPLTGLSQDLKEALIRFQFRTKNLDYCDPISALELLAFGRSFPPPPDAQLPDSYSPML